jgi:hypothetical protein
MKLALWYKKRKIATVLSNNNFIRLCSRSFTQLVRTVWTRGCRTDRARGPNAKFTRCLSSKESNYIYWNNPITSLGRPWGFQEVEAPRFQDNHHMKAARLSAWPTGGLYFLVNIPGTGWVGAILRAEVLCQWKIWVTLPGIESAMLVAQCFNQLRHRVPSHLLKYFD